MWSHIVKLQSDRFLLQWGTKPGLGGLSGDSNIPDSQIWTLIVS